jgi:hypothetical protein
MGENNNFGRYKKRYVGEGSFIAACIANGMLIHRGGLATYTNLATFAWELGDPAARR